MKAFQCREAHSRVGLAVKILLIGGGIGLAAAAIAQTASISGSELSPAGNANSSALEEITVTARKRVESIIDAPVSVQALSGNSLTNSATTDLVGLSSQIPQLNISTFPTGGGAVIAIRGIGSPSTDIGLESTVSTVFDGVQLSRGLITSLGFFDVQKVEVLKGPQALFFGKNSPAGVVSVTSNGPTDRWEGYARASYEFNAVEPAVEAAYGGPLTDTLRARVAVKYDTMNGYVTNDARASSVANPIAALAPGFFPATINTDGANTRHSPDDKTLLGRLTLDWTPSDNFDATLHVLGAHVTNHNPNGTEENKCVLGPNAEVVSLGVPVPGARCGLSTHIYLSGQPLYFAQPLPWSTSEDRPYTDFQGSLDSLDMHYTAGPLTLTSVTGYAWYANELIGGLDAAYSVIGTGQRQEYTQFSEELRASSNFDFPVNFVGGLLYEHTRTTLAEVLDVGTGLFPADPANGRYDSADTAAVVKGETLSPFFQAKWQIAPTLDLDAGARWTRESKNSLEYNTFINAFSLLSSLQPVGTSSTGSRTFYNISPEVTLTWHPADQAMLYAAYKTGYKSGGFSVPSVLVAGTTGADLLFKPEKSSGGEIGFKSRLLNDSLQITTAIYDYRYRDLQQSIFNAATINFSIANAAVANTKGIESDIAWRVWPELTLRAALSYNRGRFTDYPDAACWGGETSVTGSGSSCVTTAAGTTGSQNLSGTRLPYSSDWVEQVGFDWDRPAPALRDFRFTLGSSAHFMSTFNSSPTENPVADFGSQVLLDAHLNLYPNSERWVVGVTGSNLLNRLYLPATQDRPGGTVANGASDVFGPINRPRAVWVSVTGKF